MVEFHGEQYDYRSSRACLQNPVPLPLRLISYILWEFDWTARRDAADSGMSTDYAIDLGGYIDCGERLRSTSLGADLGGIHLQDGIKVDVGRVLTKGT